MIVQPFLLKLFCINDLSTVGAPPLPSLPPEFFARIEFTISAENKTIYLEEYFNQTGNKAEIRALGLFDAGEETRYIASYDTREFFTVQSEEKRRTST